MSHRPNAEQVSYPPPPPIPQPPPLPVEHWNPVHVVLLGIAFTPAWAGVITALNGYRLGLDILWRPVVVGVSATLLCFLLPWILAVIVYVVALVLLWKLDLRPQLEVALATIAFFCLLAVPLAQMLQGLDLPDVTQSIKEEDKRLYRPFVVGLVAKAFGSVGGKAFCLALLGGVIGIFKWLTRKPTRSESSG